MSPGNHVPGLISPTLREKCLYSSFFWSVFPTAFGLIQWECRKIRARKNPTTETFHATQLVNDLNRFVLFLDNLPAQDSGDFKKAVAGVNVVVWFGVENV